MPYPAEVYEQLRRATGENDEESTYSDSDLDFYLDASGGEVNPAASDIWREKASNYAELTDIQEAGSSRKNSVLYDHAVQQMELYGGSATGGDGGVPGVDWSTTRSIVRE
jgi:hypothetical protein